LAKLITKIVGGMRPNLVSNISIPTGAPTTEPGGRVWVSLLFSRHQRMAQYEEVET
jgi:hypothetical protein